MSSLTYTLEELCAELQMPSNYAARKFITAMEKDCDFPRQLPCKHLRWSRIAVDRWFENWDTKLPAPTQTNHPTILTKELEAAYG